MNKDNLPLVLTRKEEKDLRTLALFIACWCEKEHATAPRDLIDDTGGISLAGLQDCRLCPECRELLYYAINRRRLCPLDPKPLCKDCPIHCYQAGRRAEIRKIMRFSGRHLILRGRLDLLWHYFF